MNISYPRYISATQNNISWRGVKLKIGR
jgi:hypothetical protein